MREIAMTYEAFKKVKNCPLYVALYQKRTYKGTAC